MYFAPPTLKPTYWPARVAFFYCCCFISYRATSNHSLAAATATDAFSHRGTEGVFRVEFAVKAFEKATGVQAGKCGPTVIILSSILVSKLFSIRSLPHAFAFFVCFFFLNGQKIGMYGVFHLFEEQIGFAIPEIFALMSKRPPCKTNARVCKRNSDGFSPKPSVKGRRKDFSRGGNSGFFQGGQKVVKYDFTYSKLIEQPFFAKHFVGKFQIQGGQGPPSDPHASVQENSSEFKFSVTNQHKASNHPCCL